MKRRRLSEAARRGGILLIVAVVGALVIGAGVSYIVFGRSKAAKAADAKNAGEKAKEGEKGKGAEGQEHAELTYVDLGAFLVNIVAEGELRYLRIEVTLGVELPPEPKDKKKSSHGGHGGGKDEEGAKLPEGDDAIARDVIVRVLSVQSFSELRQGDRFTDLSEQLKGALEAGLEQCKVHKVLFTSITMQ